jgi:small ligand-binding sensory domain FIST
MSPFLHAHALHPDWRVALSQALQRVERQASRPGTLTEPTLGWVYITDHFAPHAEAIYDGLQRRWPQTHWVGATGVGVCASGVEYFDQPALVLMLADLPETRFRVFSGANPLISGAARARGFDAATALVHADPRVTDLAELVHEMSDRTSTGYLFGGLASSRAQAWQFADGVYAGGLSGVAFSRDVALLSRVTQGCHPVGPVRRITAAQRNLITRLDDLPALDCLLQDLDASESEPRAAFEKLQRVLVGLSAPGDVLLSRPGQFGNDTIVRHVAGFDPQQRGVAVADSVEVGMRAAFCVRDVEAARRDLVRICTEIREELEPEGAWREPAPVTALGTGAEGSASGAARIAGAVYVSCAGRGGPHFGGPSAELALIRQSLGDVPLAGFFAAGEIARHHVYGYTGVLTLFTLPA